MIQHIVMFKFQETACGKTKAENLEEARQRMLALREQIPQIRGMEVRLTAPGSAPGNYAVSYTHLSPGGVFWRGGQKNKRRKNV